MELLKTIGVGAVGCLVIGWLLVSFLAPSRGRTLLEWLSASALYVALLCLFASLLLRAWQAQNWLALVAFGLLALIFVGGLAVSVVMTVREGKPGGGKAAQIDATH